MVENYAEDLKESIYHGAIISALAIGFTIIRKSIIKMNPQSLGKFDFKDGAKFVIILALSDFTKGYLIKKRNS